MNNMVHTKVNARSHANDRTQKYYKSLGRIISLCKRSYPAHNYEGHLIPVVDIAMELCKRFNARPEIIEPAAYLHDIGRVRYDYLKNIGIGHELSGYHYSRLLLRLYGYSREDAALISHAVLSHSGKTGRFPAKNIEDEIIINADGISHIEEYQYLLAIRYASHGRRLKEAKEWTLKKITHSYETKLTLPGSRERVEKIYRTALEELNR